MMGPACSLTHGAMKLSMRPGPAAHSAMISPLTVLTNLLDPC